MKIAKTIKEKREKRKEETKIRKNGRKKSKTVNLKIFCIAYILLALRVFFASNTTHVLL
jgi:hypothetical protein